MKAAELRSRPLALACFFAVLALVVAVLLRAGLIPVFSSSSGGGDTATLQHHQQPQSKNLPDPVAAALLHYATSNVTPQLTAAEAGLAARVLRRRGAPCNLLVLGLGLDSALWAALNHGGRTLFLEEDPAWIAAVEARHPAARIEARHVAYDTVLTDADDLLALRAHPACAAQPDLAAAARAGCRLVPEGLLHVFHEVEWDVVLVDGPTGFESTRPGRMGVIYAAGMAARVRRPGAVTDVLVHDVDRPVEDRFSRAFLCEAYVKEEVGKLRHFIVLGSGGSNDGVPFCPPSAQGNASDA